MTVALFLLWRGLFKKVKLPTVIDRRYRQGTY
jgi:hypothetical protein